MNLGHRTRIGNRYKFPRWLKSAAECMNYVHKNSEAELIKNWYNSKNDIFYFDQDRESVETFKNSRMIST